MSFLELSIFRKAIRWLGGLLCDLIYWLIAGFYQLFMTVSRLNILSSDQIAPIYQRVTMLLMIVMTFYVTFQFVKYTMQPDTFSDKEKGAGNMLFKIVIVIIAIALVPRAFTLAYRLQNKIIETQVIQKIILGRADSNYDKFGNDFSANMLNMFYYVDETACANNTGDCSEARQAVEDNLNELRQNGTVGITGSLMLASTNTWFKESMPAIHFDGFLAIIVGGFIVYVLALYSIDVGTRYAQMLFLQLISPIAIMGYLLPKKDGIFQKWGKQCLTTYLDLFIRIALINFILLIIKILGDAFDTGSIFAGQSVTGMMKMLVYIALVMGLLAFAQKAPKMLQELFPSSGAAGIGMGLGTKDRGFAGMGRIVGGAAGAVVGGVAGAATGAIQGHRRKLAAKAAGKEGKALRRAAAGGTLWGLARGLAGGTTRGLYNGGKKGNMLKNIATGYRNQSESNKKFGNRQENGYTLKEQISDAARHTLGMKSRTELEEEKIAPAKRRQAALEKVTKAYNDMSSEAEKQVEKGAGRYSGEYADAQKRLQNIKDDKDYDSKVMTDITSGTGTAAYSAMCARVDGRTDLSSTQKAELKRNEAARMVERGELSKGALEYITVSESIDSIGNISDAEKTARKQAELSRITTEQVERDLAAAQKDVKDAKDKAVWDFITNGKFKGVDQQGRPIYEENATIVRLRGELKTDIDAYNATEQSNENKVDSATIYSAMVDGEKFDQLIKGQGSYSGNGITAQISNERNKIAEATARQEEIKRETAGSGVAGEGKK